MSEPVGPHGIRGLILDWGGVLTGAIDVAWQAWVEHDKVASEHLAAVLREAYDANGSSLVHALERGEITGSQFEQRIARDLARHGSPVKAEGLLARMFDGLAPAESMLGLAARVKAAGLRTAVLSNSWANEYPRQGWDELFDAVVISVEVGMRKPEPRIYHHVLELVDLAPGEAVFVDDLAANVAAAVEIGMVGVVYRSFEQTADELEVLLGLDLRR